MKGLGKRGFGQDVSAFWACFGAHPLLGLQTFRGLRKIWIPQKTCVSVLSHAVMSDSCDPVDCSPPGFSVYGILQARILEWVAISSSREIFPTQGSNSRLLHRQLDSLPLSHLGRDILGDTESGHKPSNYFSWISGGWEGESSSSKHNKNNSEKITSVLLKSFYTWCHF